MDVIVDTFSVFLPHDYHASPIDKFNFDILNSKVEQIDADVYISPDGDNNNNGLTVDEPFKNIDHAIYRIVSNNINQHTIHLLDGTYSPSTNDESFPIRMISNINLKGESANNVILDIQGASTGIEIRNLNALTISDISVLGNPVEYYHCGISCSESSLVLQNLIISNFNGYLESWSLLNGGGMYFYNSQAILNNLLITNNSAQSGGAIRTYHSNLVLCNATISDNRAYSPYTGIERGGGILCSDSSTIILLNTIMWNDSTQEIYSDGYGDGNEININWTDIQDGPDGIETNGNTTVNWFEGNINDDPNFVGQGEEKFELSENSLCIDVGSNDTTGLNLPAFDILGNIRIWDGNGDEIAVLDIGAYEFGSETLSTNNVTCPNSTLSFRNYPNPFNTSTFIEFQLAEQGDATISVYDLSGQLYDKVLLKDTAHGINTFEWNAQGLPAGIYFLRLEVNGVSETRKILLIK